VIGSWFFTGVIFDAFVVYDLFALAMLAGASLFYANKAALIALFCYLSLVLMGASDDFLRVDVAVQKGAYFIPFFVGAFFVSWKPRLYFFGFALIQLIAMIENIIYGMELSFISDFYPVACFFAVILITLNLRGGGDGLVTVGGGSNLQRFACVIRDSELNTKKDGKGAAQ
jgi:hypothetical protein